MNITLIAKDSTRIIFLDNSVVAAGVTYNYIDVTSFDIKGESEKILLSMVINGYSYSAEAERSLLDDLTKIKEKVDSTHKNTTPEEHHLARSIAMSNDVKDIKKDLHFIKTVVLVCVILFVINVIASIITLISTSSALSSTPSYNTNQTLDDYDSDDYD